MAPTAMSVEPLGRCAVTGGCGWTGSVLVKALREAGAISVTALDITDTADRVCDIRDGASAADALHDIDTVFHTVAYVDLRPTADEDMSMRLNVQGTANVLEALVSNSRPGPATFINLGTSDVLMGTELFCEAKMEEEVLQSPPSVYQRTKLMAEQLVRDACVAAAGDGRRELRGLTLRSPAIWGLHDRTFARMAPLPVRIGVPAARVDMIYVENLASAMVHAAVRLVEQPQQISGEAFNIRDGERNMQSLYRTELGGQPLAEGPAVLPHIMIGMARLIDVCASVIYALSGVQIQDETGMTTVAMYCAWGVHTTSTARAERLLGAWPTVPHAVALERTRAALGISKRDEN
jgi:nucleoside-diphosphate-sugar epimerase